MILADLIPGSFVTNNDLDKSLTPLCDWQNDNFKYQDSQIKEMSSWIKKNKDVLNPELTNSRQTVDVSTLNDMQKHVYDIIRAHSSQPCPKEPLLDISIGVGITGKNYLIHAIRNFLQHSFMCNNCHNWQGFLQYMWVLYSFIVKTSCWFERKKRVNRTKPC